MDLNDYSVVKNLVEGYSAVYQELDEVRGGGRIDPVSDFPHHGERGSRTPKDAGLKMSPMDRAEARANALRKRENPEATKRANRIQSRFVGPTKRGLGRAIDASNTARRGEKDRLLNKEEFDLFDYLLEYLVAEGYADTNDAAIAIMANMSEEWKQSIVEALTPAQEQRRRDLSKSINKAGTPGHPGVNDPETRAMQKQYIQLQKNR
jgi:hypothetical protein